ESVQQAASRWLRATPAERVHRSDRGRCEGRFGAWQAAERVLDGPQPFPQQSRYLDEDQRDYARQPHPPRWASAGNPHPQAMAEPEGAGLPLLLPRTDGD